MTYILKSILHLLFSPITVPRNVFMQHQLSKVNANDEEFVRLMKADGFYIFPDKLNEDDIFNLRNDFINLMPLENRSKSSGQDTGRVSSSGHSLSDIAKPYEEMFKKLAIKFFGTENIVHELSYYQSSQFQDDIDNIPGGEFHVDDNKPNIKFMLYLTDVNNNSGPFKYVPKSHGIKSFKKFIHWYLHEIFKLRSMHYGFYGLFADQELMEKRAVKITEKKGTFFCADTTGYHAADKLMHGNREVLVVSFSRKKLRYIE